MEEGGLPSVSLVAISYSESSSLPSLCFLATVVELLCSAMDCLPGGMISDIVNLRKSFSSLCPPGIWS